ncbi:hypothetical protein DIPPA_33537 [Diplonema papillatum]|nr:hypothetical protein DIPPA_33537 [Diplonema papillatum]
MYRGVGSLLSRPLRRQTRHACRRRVELLLHAKVLEWDSSSEMTERALRRQFHKMAQRHHPDLHCTGRGEVEAGRSRMEMMQEINLAFQFLLQAIRRSGGSLQVVTLETFDPACVEGDEIDSVSVFLSLTKRIQCAQTKDDLRDALCVLWTSASTGLIEHDEKILNAAIAQWGTILTFGTEHTQTCLATLERWSESFDVPPPLAILHMLLEKYSDAFTSHIIQGSTMSECWPLMVDFLMTRCEPNEYTFLIIRRMDPTIRI